MGFGFKKEDIVRSIEKIIGYYQGLSTTQEANIRGTPDYFDSHVRKPDFGLMKDLGFVDEQFIGQLEYV